MELSGHFLGDVRRECELGMQAYKGKRLQGRGFGAVQILPDHGICTISTD